MHRKKTDCVNCDNPIEVVFGDESGPPDEATAHCDFCGTQTVYQIEHEIKYSIGAVKEVKAA